MQKRQTGPSPTELRQRRDALKLSQAALAQQLGVSVTTVARWEMAPERGQPTPLMLDLALRALEAERECREVAS